MTTAFRGDTLTITGTFTDDAGDALNLAGHTFTSIIRYRDGSITPTVDDSDAATGVVSVTFETETLPRGLCSLQIKHVLAGVTKYSDIYQFDLTQRVQGE